MIREVGALLDELKGRRDAVVARDLLELETPGDK